MNDDLKNVWQSQPPGPERPPAPGEILDAVRARERELAAMTARRDCREVTAAGALVVLWVWLGVDRSLPWTWYLTIPGLIWVAGFLLLDRRRRKRTPPPPEASLRAHLESVLANLDRQIWLLRHVLWWYLLPVGVPMAGFLAHLAWRSRPGAPAQAAALAAAFAAMVAVGWAIHRLNRRASDRELRGRREETRRMLQWLDDPEGA